MRFGPHLAFGLGMVVIETSPGSTQEYQLHSEPQGLRLVGRYASYDLATMMRDAGWQIVGVRSEAAERLLEKAGLLSAAVAVLPRSGGPFEWNAITSQPNDFSTHHRVGS